MKNPWIIIGVLAIVLIGGSVWYSTNVQERNNEGIVITANIKGNENAPVTLTEYSDFQCPACAAFQPVVKNILSEFPDDVKLEYKHFPLPIHSLAEPAARAAEAAGQQDAFFAYHDLLFENQTAWSNTPNPTALFFKYAADLELDVDLFKRHYNSSVLRDRVKVDLLEARGLGLTGTPTFYLNGERMNIETYEDFYNQIAAAVNPDVVFDLIE
ncbi:MAG TPA: thioredoxin domain-containing protein [Candidatus Paceibacterota bacterium]|nr:thioredoxin domain-containing protein [Candidatus Paceibacterota bacterium]HMO82884.1 thioredoxin domain-containing protein [Candidatus Paceibacterota bacterium]